MADQPKPIAVSCPSCGSRLQVSKDLVGKRGKCPKCQQAFTVGGRARSPEQTTDRQAERNASQQATGEEQQTAASARWNFLVSANWLLLGWSFAIVAPWLVFLPGWMEAAGNSLPLAVTVGLIGWNLVASLRILGRTGRAVAALPLTSLQVLLFALLLFQIACHRGAEHFAWDRSLWLFDWLGLVVVHAVRAADLMDFIEAYGLDFQAIHGASHLSAWSLIFLHLVIDLFILRLLMEAVGRWRRTVLGSDARLRFSRRLIIGFTIGFVLVWLISALFIRPWRWVDIFMWPLDNLLRVVDFADMMEIYHFRLHQVPGVPWEGTLTLVCRVMMAVGLAGWLNRGMQAVSIRWLKGWGLSQEELVQIARDHSDEQLRHRANDRAREVADLQARSHQVRWASRLEVAATLGPTFALVLFLLIAVGPDTCGPLTAAATGSDERQAQRAHAAIQRMGPRAKAAVAPLVESLQKLSPPRRVAVLRTLGHIGPSAVEALGEAIEEQDEQTRLVAIGALQKIGPVAVPTLVRALSSDDGDVRGAARDALIALGPEAIEALVEHVTEENAIEILAVLDELDPYWHLQSSTNPTFAELVGARDLLRRLQEAPNEAELKQAANDLTQLGTLGSRLAVAGLTDRLQADDAGLRAATVRVLVQLGASSPVLLGELLGAEDETVRNEAARTFQEIGAPAVPVLVERLAGSDADVQQRAGEVLQQIGVPAVPALVERLAESDAVVQQRAAEVLQRIGSPAVPALVERLSDSDAGVQQRATEVLQHIGEPAVPVLVERLADGDAGVQQRAAEVLQHIGEPAVPVLVERLAGSDVGVQQRAAEVLQHIGEPAIRMLVERLAGSDVGVQQRAAEVLQHIGAAAVPALGELIADSDAGVQQRATEVLQHIGEPAIRAIVERLADSDVGVQQRAAEVLQQIGAAAVPVLVERLADSDASVQQRAAEVLQRIGEPAVPALVERLSDSDAGVQQRTAELLQQIASAFAERLSDGDVGAQQRAAEVLQKIGQPAVASLVDRLADSDAGVQQRAAYVLQRIGSPAVPALVERLADGDAGVQQRAAEVLQQIGVAFAERLGDSDADVRERAAEMAEQIFSLPAVAPFGELAAKQYQQQWAKLSGLPVEQTNSIGMKLVLIPAGAFVMDSPHRVRITKPFWLGMTEVTQEQYERVMGVNPSEFKGDPQRPVESVSWDDAAEFCRKLSEKEGQSYRLPTEAEWEYACRAGTVTQYCFGDNEASLGQYAWCSWYQSKSGRTTHSVGQKMSNAWGLYDMHGNVREWCQDWYADYPDSPMDDPTGPAAGSFRVNRGGCWSRAAGFCRSSLRLRFVPSGRTDDLGFRVAAVPSSK